MSKTPISKYIKQLNRPVFSTRELSDISGKSASVVAQALNNLAKHCIITKLYRGLWADTSADTLSPYNLVPHLFKNNRVYVSFLSALHLHGIIDQIPQTITLASTSHTKTVKTTVGTYIVHSIAPQYFFGFDWYKGSGSFLIAEPEKALADSLYLFTRKKNQYGFFPELNLNKPFSKNKLKQYVERIPDKNARTSALAKLQQILVEVK
jgi:predicted transcriptional regulator of viral defense system